MFVPDLPLSTSANFTNFANATGQAQPEHPEFFDTNGALAWQSDGLRLQSMGSGTKGAQGGMKVFQIPADVNGHVGAANFYSYFNIFAWSGAKGQTGILEVLYADANNKLIMGYGVIKSDTSGNMGTAQFFVGGNNPRMWKLYDFETNNNENGKNAMFNQSSGHTDIVKSGANLEWYWMGSRDKLYVPELEMVECRKIFVYIGQYKGRSMSNFMSNLSLRKLNFQKNNIPQIKDVPNRYPSGSQLLINMDTAKIYQNNVSANDQLVTGSEFFPISPGNNELNFYFSDFMINNPTIEVSWKERWL
jgi:hypothetical protein